MLLLWWCPQYKKEKQAGLQLTNMDQMSLVSTPLRIRWTISLWQSCHPVPCLQWGIYLIVQGAIVVFGEVWIWKRESSLDSLPNFRLYFLSFFSSQLIGLYSSVWELIRMRQVLIRHTGELQTLRGLSRVEELCGFRSVFRNFSPDLPRTRERLNFKFFLLSLFRYFSSVKLIN